MKFNPPPNWPVPPEGWAPDPGWNPDPTWPEPPKDWTFWVNDYGVPIEGPPGYFGGPAKRNRGRVLTGVGLVLAFIMGIAVSSTADTQPTANFAAPATTTVPGPTFTVTATATSAPETVTKTVTATASPTTVTETLEPPTVTVTETRTVTASGQIQGFVGGGGGSGGGTNPGSSVYYANCSEARAAGAAPIYRGEPGYRSGLDRDNDGVACE